jgi:hypothetical protein
MLNKYAANLAHSQAYCLLFLCHIFIYLRENAALDVAPAHIKIYAAYTAYFVYTKFQAY